MLAEEKKAEGVGRRLTLAAAVRESGRPACGRWISALVATLLLHAFAAAVLPRGFLAPQPRITPPDRPLQVWLEPAEEPEPPGDFSFTNPEVPANPPDEARFFSDRNQQAAQEEPTDEGDPGTPDIAGAEPEPTQNIREGTDAIRPEEIEEWLESPQEALAELPEARPVPGFDPAQESDGIGPPVTPDPAEPSPELEIGVPVERAPIDPTPAEPSPSQEERPEQPQPRPRPVLPQFSGDPVGRRVGAAPRVGEIAVDANFSEFGDYIARMLDVIGRQWHILAWESLRSAETGTVVSVSFQIDARGQVRNLEVLQSTASLTATLICQDAIASRQPYGEWTPDMREVLGEEQTIRIRFLYR